MPSTNSKIVTLITLFLLEVLFIYSVKRYIIAEDETALFNNNFMLFMKNTYCANGDKNSDVNTGQCLAEFMTIYGAGVILEFYWINQQMNNDNNFSENVLDNIKHIVSNTNYLLILAIRVLASCGLFKLANEKCF